MLFMFNDIMLYTLPARKLFDDVFQEMQHGAFLNVIKSQKHILVKAFQKQNSASTKEKAKNNIFKIVSLINICTSN